MKGRNKAVFANFRASMLVKAGRRLNKSLPSELLDIQHNLTQASDTTFNAFSHGVPI